MKDYNEYYIKKRINLSNKYGALSAGLQPRIFILDSSLNSNNNGVNSKIEFLSSTTEKYMFGGTYFWSEIDKINSSKLVKILQKEPISGYTNGVIRDLNKIDFELPIFNTPIPVPIKTRSIYPVEFNKEENPNQNIAIGYVEGFPVFYKYKRSTDNSGKNNMINGDNSIKNSSNNQINKPPIIFEEDEILSERFGAGLIEKNIGQFNACKMIAKDITGNGLLDIIVGENDWSEYFPDGKRWSNKDYRPFDENRNYRGGPLHGRVHLFKNLGEDPDDPEIYRYSNPITLENIDQYGFCTPVFEDFNNNGMEDLICGNFIRDITFFKRLGNDENGIPLFDKGVNICQMPGVINYVEKINKDLIISSENGHIYILKYMDKCDENGVPVFSEPIPLIQINAPAKSDILPTPSFYYETSHNKPTNNINKYQSPAVLCGNGAGNFEFFKIEYKSSLIQHFKKQKSSITQDESFRFNYRGQLNEIPRVLPPLPGGSIQGPSEIGWGYTTATAFDWNNNGLLDLVFSGINGEHKVSLNSGKKNVYGRPIFEKPIHLSLINKNSINNNSDNSNSEIPFIGAWRVKPALIRDKKNLVHYLCLNKEGILIHYMKVGDFSVKEVSPVKSTEIENDGRFSFTTVFGGSRGRDKFTFIDWNHNGKPDLLIGLPANHSLRHMHPAKNYVFYHQATIAVMLNAGKGWDDNEEISEDNNPEFLFDPPRYVAIKNRGIPPYMGHHSCSPAVIKKDNREIILLGAEDGHFYQFDRDELEIMY